MIKFDCKNCGKRVFVEETGAGHVAECPLCGQVETTSGQHCHGDLCRLQCSGDDAEHGQNPDDTNLSMRMKDPAAETDILPAQGRQNHPSDVNQPQNPAKADAPREVEPPSPPVKPSSKRRGLYLAVIAIALAVAIAVSVMLFSM